MMIYLDNAATTLEKPPAVLKAVSKSYANPGRGGNSLSVQASEVIFNTRILLAGLFKISDPTRIVFTQNTTHALNIALKGILREGDHVVITGMEHNSVLRPLHTMGAKISAAKPSSDGIVSADSFERLITPSTKLIAAVHASNVCGSINPVYDIGRLAKRKNIPFLVDAAQTAGLIDIDAEKNNISLLAFPGHKLLYGPQGTGGLYIREGLTLRTLTEGGTGSFSEDANQPQDLPERFESGTLNTPGIAGLGQGVSFILSRGIDEIYDYEYKLNSYFTDRILQTKNVKLYGPYDPRQRAGVFGMSIKGIDSASASNILSDKFRILTRGGLHCAILAHKSLGTQQDGLLRVSFSRFTKKSHIDSFLKALKSIAE